MTLAAGRNTQRMTGTVKSVVTEKGFGFIATAEGEFFFHRTSCTSVPFTELRPGARVSFTPSSSAKGPRAESIGLA